MMRGLLGANAIAPIAKVASPSERGRHDTPALRVSQIPPCEAPTSHRLGSVGSTAIDTTRPLTGWGGLTCPSRIGAGPMFVQRTPPAEIAEGSRNVSALAEATAVELEEVATWI